MPKVELPFEALLEATEQLDARQLQVMIQRVDELQRRQKKMGLEVEAEQLKEGYEKPSLSHTQGRAESQ